MQLETTNPAIASSGLTGQKAKMSASPSITASIVIVAYNYERYIDECIRSCMNQTAPFGYEVILVDDGSTDGTLKIAKAFGDQIRILSGANQGVEAASNRGIREARGEFVVRVDADDKLQPTYLEKVVPMLQASSAAFAYPKYD